MAWEKNNGLPVHFEELKDVGVSVEALDKEGLVQAVVQQLSWRGVVKQRGKTMGGMKRGWNNLVGYMMENHRKMEVLMGKPYDIWSILTVNKH